jgi:non-specific protein-tyrosine kinase
VASNRVTNAAIAAMVGFVLAAAGAYVMEYLDRSLQSAYDVGRYLNLLILGAIPKMKRRYLQKYGPLAIFGPRAPVIDAYAALRLSVQTALDNHPLGVLLITSPAPEEGKSSVAANLAIDWARSGQKVILVDADLYHPSQQRLFDLPNQTGLTTAFVDVDMNAEDLLKPTKIKGLSVLTSGPILPNPTSLLSQQAMHRLMSALRAQADVIVIDTPPATAVVDASILALQADGVLLVVTLGQTKREAARRTVELFHQIRAPLLGVALFNSPMENSLYQHYEGRYGGRVNLPETLQSRYADKGVKFSSANGHDRTSRQRMRTPSS